MLELTPRSKLRNGADDDIKLVMLQSFETNASFESSKEKVAAAFRCTVEELTKYFTDFKRIVDDRAALSARLPQLEKAKKEQWAHFWENFWITRPTPDDGAKLDRDQANFAATIKQISDQIDVLDKSEEDFCVAVTQKILLRYGNIAQMSDLNEWKSKIIDWQPSSSQQVVS